MSLDYVLITAAHNEEKFIATTIRSVIAQTVRPRKWVIVSDASSDGTDHIVRGYAARHPFIELHRIREDHPRNFGAQVEAINFGYEQLRAMPFSFVGNVDADVALPPAYYETLLRRFADRPALGLAGGFIYEDHGRGFQSRRTNSPHSVAHATQVFRRECFDAIGGYLRLEYGGPDWVAEIMARQRGWMVEAFADLVVQHYRPAGSAGGVVRGWYRQGRMDHSLGTLPLFELVKCLRRIPERPFVLGTAARIMAFLYSYLIGAPRLVPPDVVHELREEQRRRLRGMIGLRPHPPASPIAHPAASPAASSSPALQRNVGLSD
ncbi:MAG TPA: glycosyltransferase family A protein [Terriglobales bacterium]|nr:glycosyltransferase family A protein [Terriglobales bacterium]